MSKTKNTTTKKAVGPDYNAFGKELREGAAAVRDAINDVLNLEDETLSAEEGTAIAVEAAQRAAETGLTFEQERFKIVSQRPVFQRNEAKRKANLDTCDILQQIVLRFKAAVNGDILNPIGDRVVDRIKRCQGQSVPAAAEMYAQFADQLAAQAGGPVPKLASPVAKNEESRQVGPRGGLDAYGKAY